MVGDGILTPPGLHFPGLAPPTNAYARQIPTSIGRSDFPVAPGPVYSGSIPAGAMPTAAAPSSVAGVRTTYPNPISAGVSDFHSNPISNPDSTVAVQWRWPSADR